jgi:chromosome partitioning protein
MHTIAIANQKGGVGKTALAANLGAALAERGHKVLLVDLDFNAALSSCMGWELAPEDLQIADVLDPERRVPLREVIRPTRSPLVDVAPAEIALSVLEASLPLSQTAWPVRLREALEEVRGRYGVVLLDTHPNIGPLLTMAVVAADSLIAPVQTHHQARRAVALLLDHVRRVRRRNGIPDLPCWIVRTMLRRGVAHDAEVARLLEEEHPGRVLSTVISLSAVHADTSVPAPGGRSVLWDYPRHPAAEQYRMLAEEVEQRVLQAVPA